MMLPHSSHDGSNVDFSLTTDVVERPFTTDMPKNVQPSSSPMLHESNMYQHETHSQPSASSFGLQLPWVSGGQPRLMGRSRGTRPEIPVTGFEFPDNNSHYRGVGQIYSDVQKRGNAHVAHTSQSTEQITSLPDVQDTIAE